MADCSGGDEQPYLHLGTTSLVMQQVLQQILHCPYQGITRQMYLEGKVLELLALQLEQAIANHQAPSQLQSLRPDDIDRIYQAKEILIQNLDNPPSLMTLARQVGLNDFKLKLGFRQVLVRLCLATCTTTGWNKHNSCCKKGG